MTEKERLRLIESYPASKAAVNHLANLERPILDWIPSVLQLAQWAVEEADTYNLDSRGAEPILNDLVSWTMMGEPLPAVLLLLDVDDEETEIPPEMMHDDPEELAAGMLNLLQNAGE